MNTIIIQYLNSAVVGKGLILRKKPFAKNILLIFNPFHVFLTYNMFKINSIPDLLCALFVFCFLKVDLKLIHFAGVLLSNIFDNIPHLPSYML